MLGEDLPQSVVGLLSRQLFTARRGDGEFGFALSAFAEALVHGEGVGADSGGQGDLRLLVAALRVEGPDLRGGGIVLDGQHCVERVQDRGFAGLVLAVNEDEAGVRQVGELEVLDRPDIVDDQGVDTH